MLKFDILFLIKSSKKNDTTTTKIMTTMEEIIREKNLDNNTVALLRELVSRMDDARKEQFWQEMKNDSQVLNSTNHDQSKK